MLRSHNTKRINMLSLSLSILSYLCLALVYSKSDRLAPTFNSLFGLFSEPRCDVFEQKCEKFHNNFHFPPSPKKKVIPSLKSQISNIRIYIYGPYAYRCVCRWNEIFKDKMTLSVQSWCCRCLPPSLAHTHLFSIFLIHFICMVKYRDGHRIMEFAGHQRHHFTCLLSFGYVFEMLLIG